MQISDIEFTLLRDFLLKETGIDIPESKRYLFSTRMSDLLEKERCKSFSDFFLVLTKGSSHLIRATIETMTTHESSFFRDPQHFQLLMDTILPAAALRKDRQRLRIAPRIRILSAGCSFGQEPYTIAICVNRWLSAQSNWSAQDVSITAIDISTRALERAKLGVFTDLELGQSITDADKERFFIKQKGQWTITPTLRNQIEFKCINLTRPWNDLGKFDVIFCRNVIIYFAPDQKTQVLSQLRDALDPDGALFLGSMESMYGTNIDFVHKVIGQSSYYEAPPIQTLNGDLSWKF